MQRHVEFILKLASQLEEAFGSGGAYRPFASEQDNFRAALAWASRRACRLSTISSAAVGLSGGTAAIPPKGFGGWNRRSDGAQANAPRVV